MYWKQLVGFIVIGLICFMAYTHVFNRGVEHANKKWGDKMAVVEKFRDSQINEIQGFTKTNLEQTLTNNAEIARQLAAIQKGSKALTLTSVPCVPSENFINTYNSVIDKVNKK
jgi:hypothetical protein